MSSVNRQWQGQGEPGPNMALEHRLRRRVVFDDVPELYDSVRPGYPSRLFDDLFVYLGKDPRDVHVVEMGAGTGKATIPLLERGCQVTAVELGPAMAAYLRRRTSEFDDRIDVITAAFEEADLPSNAFDVVFAATAWHWVDPVRGLRIARSLLRSGGVIALLGIVQVSGDGERDFFMESQSIYRDLGLDQEPWTGAPQRTALVNDDRRMLETAPLFTDVEEFRVNWDITYTSADYVRLKQTHSDLRLLDDPTRTKYLHRIADLIDAEFDGRIIRPGVACLCLGRVS